MTVNKESSVRRVNNSWEKICLLRAYYCISLCALEATVHKDFIFAESKGVM